MVISPPQFGGWSHYIYGSQYSIPRFNQIGSESTRLCSVQMTQLSTRPRQALGARKDQIFQVSQYRQLQFGFAFQVLCGLNPWLFPMILHLLERTFRWSVRRVYFKYRDVVVAVVVVVVGCGCGCCCCCWLLLLLVIVGIGGIGDIGSIYNYDIFYFE